MISRALWSTKTLSLFSLASSFRICAYSDHRALPPFSDLVYCALQSLLMLVSLFEETTSAENEVGEARLHNSLPQSAPKAFLQILHHSPLPLTQIYLHFGQLRGAESLQVLIFKVLPCFTSSEAMESPTSKSDVIRLLMNLK